MAKLNFLVCPHDTARKPERWYLFAQLLGKHIGSIVSFEPCLDFNEFHEKLTSADIIYANPQDSLKLYQHNKYIPLAHPVEMYDEVVFISSRDRDQASLQDIDGQGIVSVRSMMPTCLAIEFLNAQNIRPTHVENRDSWMAVVKSVYKGDISFGLLYKDFYDGLNELTRSAFNVIDETREQKIHHMFMLKPSFSNQSKKITDSLLKLHTKPQATDVLGALDMKRLQRVDPETMSDLKKLSKVLENCRALPHENQST